MLRKQSCISLDDRARYPYSETLLFFTDGASTIDSDNVMKRNLLPVTSLDVLTNRKEIYLRTIEFAGYDTSNSLLKKIEGADKEFANEYIYGNMLSATGQPNYFRPVMRINGDEVVSNISTLNPDNIDLSRKIGLPLPFCLTIDKSIKNPSGIEIVASLAQKTASGYRNYPVLAIVEFWHNGT